ncbi:MAG TPA: hypothetical protein PLW83_07900, partial [Deltaproteobacteria bacterium]|nr:hypothetical protein [Deltaproteobacteria bacterium]
MTPRLMDTLGSLDAVGFLPASLQALAAASMLRRRRRAVLWVVEDTEAMERAEDDLLCFLGPDEIRLFPPYDVRPYQDDSPSREILAARISALDALARTLPAVVVTPVNALMGYTMTRDDLLSAAVEVREGDWIDRDELASRLVRMGYVREALIDDVGQFSVRGSVMDLFSPGMGAPVRIDMFGDEIVAVKMFDVRTQRTTRAV